jgi:DNA-binding transcriptional regulator YiaG
MTERKGRPGAPGAAGDAEVVSITTAAAGRVGYKRFASARVATARRRLGMTPAEFAEYLSGELGWQVTAEAVGYWENTDAPPSEVYLAADAAGGLPSGPPLPLLDSVPHGLPAAAIAGPWVTAYQFGHAGTPHYHADVAHVAAEGDREIRVVNHPPEPRTQGRASPFRNEIEGRLFGRHVIGTWRNVSDTRYYGSLHLAVLPGETVMDGHYTGLASDISVSVDHWRWVRLGPGDLSAVRLREPTAIYELVMSRTQDDPPLTAADIGEDS